MISFLFWAISIIRLMIWARFLKEKGENVAVILDQAGTGKASGKLFNHLLDLVVFHPVVDDLDLLPQNRQHHHFGETLTEAVGRMLLAVEVDNLPAKAVELVKEGLFDVVTFVEPELCRGFLIRHTIHPSATHAASASRTFPKDGYSTPCTFKRSSSHRPGLLRMYSRMRFNSISSRITCSQ